MAPPRRPPGGRGALLPSPRAMALQDKLRDLAHGSFTDRGAAALVEEPETSREVLLSERRGLRVAGQPGEPRDFDVEVSECVTQGADAWSGLVTGYYVSVIGGSGGTASASLTLDVDRLWRMCGVDDEVLLLHKLTVAGAGDHVRPIRHLSGVEGRHLLLSLLSKIVVAPSSPLRLFIETTQLPDASAEANVTLERLRTREHATKSGNVLIARLQQVQAVQARRRDVAVRRVQTAYRRHRLHRELEYHRQRFCRFREQKAAARVLQAAARIMLAHRRVAAERLRQRRLAAAIRLQAFARMVLARRVVWRILAERKDERHRIKTLLVLQCAARMFLARRRLEDMRRFRAGLVRLQAAARRILVCAQVERQRRRRLRAAGKLVAVWGTRQGHSGWYLTGEERLSFFHRLAGGAWEMVLELDEDELRALRSQAIRDGKMVPAPGVGPGQPGLYIDVHGMGAVWTVTPSGAWRNKTHDIEEQLPATEQISTSLYPLQREVVWRGRHRIAMRSMIVEIHAYGKSGFLVHARFGTDPPQLFEGRMTASLMHPPFEGRMLERLRAKLDRLDIVPHPIRVGERMLRLRASTASRRRGPEGNAAVVLQKNYRRFATLNKWWAAKATMALGTERSGVSVSCPGTAQGYPGWYFGRQGGLFYMEPNMVNTWEVVAGPLSRRMRNELWRRARHSTGEAVPLPGTVMGTTGVYMSARGEAQFWAVDQYGHWVLYRQLLLGHATRLALLLQALYRAQRTRRAWQKVMDTHKDKLRAERDAIKRKERRAKRSELRMAKSRKFLPASVTSGVLE